MTLNGLFSYMIHRAIASWIIFPVLLWKQLVGVVPWAGAICNAALPYVDFVNVETSESDALECATAESNTFLFFAGKIPTPWSSLCFFIKWWCAFAGVCTWHVAVFQAVELRQVFPFKDFRHKRQIWVRGRREEAPFPFFLLLLTNGTFKAW